MTFTLVGYQDEYRCNKVQVAAKLAGVSVTVRSADSGLVAASPLQVVPYLETGCCGTVAGHNACARYVASRGPQSNLMGRSFQERAQVEMWLDWSGYELEPWRDVWVYPVLGVNNFPRDQKAYHQAKVDVTAKMKVLNEHLASRTYLVGQRMTLADIAVCAALFDCFGNVFDKAFRGSFTNVHRYFLTVANQPAFSSIFGKPAFADSEKMPAGGAKKGNRGGGKKKQQAKKKEQPQAEKKDSPKPAKKKVTLKDLPKSKVILDDVKRLFSNNPFDEASKKFYADFDAKGYCCYVSKYNYNEDNTVDFMTMNLCTGFLQRLDPARKWGMGVLNVAGKGPYEITGAWVFRGSGIPPPVTDSADAEYHTWTKIDLDNPTDKAKWEEYMNSETVDGQPLEERKWFK